jgi:hypothetical protein
MERTSGERVPAPNPATAIPATTAIVAPLFVTIVAFQLRFSWLRGV